MMGRLRQRVVVKTMTTMHVMVVVLVVVKRSC